MNHKPASSSLSRRTFVKGAAVSSAVLGFPAITQSKSPNGKLAVGLIGVGDADEVTWRDAETSKWFPFAT